MELNKTVHALLYLMRCALQNTVPEAIEGLDYEALYRLSASHSVVAMTAMALESGGLLTESYASPECIKKWKDAKVKAVRKNILLDAEREQIFAHFEKHGIWYLPLKGSVLKDLYPQMGMRQMADNDILFDASYQCELKEFMEKRGYEATHFGQGNHDVYKKAPVYNYEFHTALFDQHRNPAWENYYQNVKEKLIKDTNNSYGYHFSNEDFYIYFLLHGYKHYASSGTGIRFLSDIFVFLKKTKDSMDWDYVNQELKKLNILEFASKTEHLADKLFGFETSEMDEELSFLKDIMDAGTYGTMEIHVSREMNKVHGKHTSAGLKKLRYVWSRVFPDDDFMKSYHPLCRKHPRSIPLIRIYRIIKGVICRRKQILQECLIIYRAK